MDPDADDSLDQYRIVPVQIITIERVEGTDQSKYILNKHALDRLLAKIGDLKVALIFNVGTQGEGNSFLLNKVGRHIINSMRNGVPSGPADEQDVDYDIVVIDDPDDPLIGFEWNTDPNETTTRGIWFSQPFIVRKTGGEELAIILVDTQGLDGDDCTPQDMSTIVGLSLLSASTLVFNVRDGLRDDVLKCMNSYIDYTLRAGKYCEGNPDVQNLFQDIIIMIRDWSRPVPPHAYGLEGGRHFINTRLETNANQREAARSVRNSVRKSFNTIQCFLMPDPGLNARLQGFTGSTSELSDEFSANVRDFCHFLINPDTIQVKTINGQPITGHEFGQHFEIFVNMFNNKSIEQDSDGHIQWTNDIALSNQLKDEYTEGMSAQTTGHSFVGRKHLATASQDLINGLVTKFAFNLKSSAESVVRELKDQLSRTLEAAFKQIYEENENRRLTATNDKVTEFVNEFKRDIGRHIKQGDYFTEHNMNKIIDTKRDHILILFDEFAADELDLFAEYKKRLCTQLESEEKLFKSNNSRIKQEKLTRYETITTSLKSKYDQKMSDLFSEQDRFYDDKRLEKLSADILSSLMIELAQVEQNTGTNNGVPTEPYKLALSAYVVDKYRHYKEMNRMRTDLDRITMSVKLDELNHLYEKELDAWIDCTNTNDERCFVKQSKMIRTRIVSENNVKYGQRLDYRELKTRFKAMEGEMRDVFIEAVNNRVRDGDAIASQAIQWYNRELTREYGDRPYIRLNRLDDIHERLVSEALVRFKTNRGHIALDQFNKVIREKLDLVYEVAKKQNSRNAPTIPAIGIDLGTTNSCVAYYKPGYSGQEGKIKICRNNYATVNNDVTPSCIEYRDNGEVVVGAEAKDNLLANRQNIIYSAKRMIGLPFSDPDITRYRKKYWPFRVVDVGDGAAGVEVEVNGESRQLLPEEVSAEVLRTMKAVAERDISLFCALICDIFSLELLTKVSVKLLYFLHK